DFHHLAAWDPPKRHVYTVLIQASQKLLNVPIQGPQPLVARLVLRFDVPDDWAAVHVDDRHLTRLADMKHQMERSFECEVFRLVTSNHAARFIPVTNHALRVVPNGPVHPGAGASADGPAIGPQD